MYQMNNKQMTHRTHLEFLASGASAVGRERTMSNG